MKQQRAWVSLIAFILMCFVGQIIGSYWTNQSVSTWYPTLVKPSWTPPGWVFGPVWTLLYISIAIAGWQIYKSPYSQQRSIALFFYGCQLILNFLWSFFFFYLKSPFLGLIDIALLLLMIVLTIIKAWSVRSSASMLLIPYLIWIMYATSLNAGIWLLNG